MPFTDEEQVVFNRAMDGPYIDEPDDKVFMRQFADRMVELTGNVFLQMRMDNIVEKL